VLWPQKPCAPAAITIARILRAGGNIMSHWKNVVWGVAVATLALAGSAGIAFAQSGSSARGWEASILGGAQVVNENDTGVPDQFVNIPLVGSVSYHLTPNWALEGEFTWIIPTQQSVDMGTGSEQDRKSPDVLSYQAGVRASLPLTTWTPYLAAGLGAVTFLSNDDADRVPKLDESQTAFALNFGGGASVPIAGRWALRADLRELVAFPASDAQGFSTGGSADPIWMERLTVGVGYRF
jgi:opacity protein-like surface antigen